MVDPGSVIGVVSLGLQVAQGLVKYYSDFKAYDEDISHAVGQIERLGNTLAVLEVTLRGLGPASDIVLELVRTSMCKCEYELKKLDEVVEKCVEIPASQTLVMRMKMAEKKLLYPLRKCTLKSVCAWVNQAQTNLDTTIQTLNFQLQDVEEALRQQQDNMSTLLQIARSTIKQRSQAQNVSRGFLVQQVVTRDNPAWRVVIQESQQARHDNHDDSSIHSLEKIKRGIAKCYRKGSAGPTDVFEGGETLLVRVCDWLPYLMDTNNITSLDRALELLGFLVDAGAPIDAANFATAGRPSPLEILICWGIPELSRRRVDVARLCAYLVEQGFTWSTEALLLDDHRFDHLSARNLLSRCDIVEGFDGDPVESAIWRKSTKDLKTLIPTAIPLLPESSQQSSMEIAKYLTTSSDWPEGLRIILSFAKYAPVLTCWRHKYHDPLRAAYGFENWKSVQVLLDHGFRIDPKLFEWGLKRSSNAATQHMLRLTCHSHYVNKRLSFCKGFSSVRLFILSGRVYSLQMDQDVADALYDAGFRTIDDEFDDLLSSRWWQGAVTPLWKVQNVLCR